MSQSGSNCSVRLAAPSRATEDVLSTPSTASSAGSSTATIWRSTSSGPAPVQATDTVTVSITTSGKNCWRIDRPPQTPASSISAISRLAAVRWAMK